MDDNTMAGLRYLGAVALLIALIWQHQIDAAGVLAFISGILLPTGILISKVATNAQKPN